MPRDQVHCAPSRKLQDFKHPHLRNLDVIGDNCTVVITPVGLAARDTPVRTSRTARRCEEATMHDMRIAVEERAWQDQANCLGVDPDLFFPERGTSTREAKEVCRGCVVRMECLEYALANGEKFGIWGGLSERERRRIRRQRAQAARRTATA